MYRFYRRQFLNLRGHHAGAYVLAVVEALPEDPTEESWREITLELTDCWRRVVFEFPLVTAADRRNSVRKARLLADVTAGFAEALAIEADLEAARRSSRRRK